MEAALQYFKHAEKILEANEFEDEESYQLFVHNVFSEVEGLEYRLSCSHDGSTILEKITRHATGFQLRVFFEKVRDKWLDMCCHRYASHVVETWLKVALIKATTPGEVEQETEGLPKLLEQLADIAAFVTEEPLRLMEDPYGSHVVRLLLRAWQGQLDGSHVKLPSGPDYMDAFVDVIFALPREVFDITKAIQSVQTSSILQYIISSPGGYGKKFLDTLFPAVFVGVGGEVSKEGQRFLRLAESEAGSRFFESLISSLDAGMLLMFFNKLARGNVQAMIEGFHANFVLQCIISRCHNISQFRIVVEQVKEFAPQLVEMKRHGILMRIAQWVTEHELAGAEEAMGLVFEAFHLKDSQDRKKSFIAISRLQVKEDIDENAPLSAAGCSLLQLLPHFPDVIAKPVIDGFLDYPVAALVSMAAHPQGSRVIEAAFASRNVTSTVKQRTIRKLRDHVDSLAANKFGSHIVDRAWSLGTTELKEKIVERLLSARTKLEDSPHGRIVLRNCRAYEFARNAESWKQAEEGAERRKAMFDELLNDVSNDLLPATLQVTVEKGKGNGRRKDGKRLDRDEDEDEETVKSSASRKKKDRKPH